MYGDILRINDEIQKRIAAQNMYASSAINAIIFATYYRLVRAPYILYISYIICHRCVYVIDIYTYISFSPCHNDPLHVKLCKFIQTFSTTLLPYKHSNRRHRFMMNLPMTCTIN